MSAEGIAAVMDHVVATGHGEWEAEGSKARCRIFFKSLNEWASLIYEFATANAMVGSVYTVYELHSGDATTDAPFHGLEAVTLNKALQVLEGQGRAALFSGSSDSPDDTGVKFVAT